MAYETLANFKTWLADNPAHLVDAAGSSLDTLLTALLDEGAQQVEDDTDRRYSLTTAEARSYYELLKAKYKAQILVPAPAPTAR